MAQRGYEQDRDRSGGRRHEDRRFYSEDYDRYRDEQRRNEMSDRSARGRSGGMGDGGRDRGREGQGYTSGGTDYSTQGYGRDESQYRSDYDRSDRSYGGQGYGRGGGGQYRGKGPKGYQRDDNRIKEDVSERLSDSDEVDASEIEVHVNKGEVTLEGLVAERYMKRMAEDIAENVSGVKDVSNHLRVKRQAVGESTSGGRSETGASTTSGTPMTAEGERGEKKRAS